MAKYRTKTLWLLEVVGDVEPEVHGPFGTVGDQSKAARNLRANDEDAENGLYWLDVVDGVPQVGAYSGGFFEGGFDDDQE